MDFIVYIYTKGTDRLVITLRVRRALEGWLHYQGIMNDITQGWWVIGDVSVVLRVQAKRDVGKLEKFVSLCNVFSHFCFSLCLCFYPLIHTSGHSALLKMFFVILICGAMLKKSTPIYRKLCFTSYPFSTVILLEFVWQALTKCVLLKINVLLRESCYNKCLWLFT